MNLRIPYRPHPKQEQVHNDGTRFKVIAAGRRAGKTTLALHELVRFALSVPNGRSWYVAPTYRQAKSVVWDDPADGIFGIHVCQEDHRDDPTPCWAQGMRKFLPKELVKETLRSELSIKLINDHLIELKGAENKDKLRGAGIRFLVLDEFGHMSPDVWTSILRPMLAKSEGKAVFIGTPSQTGSPHFKDLFDIGQNGKDPDVKSWIFFTKDNPAIKGPEIEQARRSLPPDEFKREWEADFSVAEGLVYDNFNFGTHVIPSYEPSSEELVIGSIDPGIYYETGMVLSSWTKAGVGRIFKEYYQKGFLAQSNAERILAVAKPYNVSYWVIDKAASKRNSVNDISVYDCYREYFNTNNGGPIYLAPNNPGSVIKGINEVRRLLHQNKLFISAECTNFINEITHYAWYEPRWHNKPVDGPEKPRKYKDHLMDCIKNIVLTKPWQYRGANVVYYNGLKQTFGY